MCRRRPKNLVLVQVVLLSGLLLGPTLVSGHHEAIFGPQSSLVLSADRFVSFQVFTRELGTDDATTGMGSLERGSWSVIGYTAAQFNVEDSQGDKDGDHVFIGGGFAYTPNEDFQTGRLFRYQAGWSFEHYARDPVAGQPQPDSGGDQFLLHPTRPSRIRRATVLWAPPWCRYPDGVTSETRTLRTDTARERG